MPEARGRVWLLCLSLVLAGLGGANAGTRSALDAAAGPAAVRLAQSDQGSGCGYENDELKLYAAVEENDLSGVKCLLKAGHNVNEVSKTSQFSPLGVAAFDGRKAIVEALIAGGADPNLGSPPPLELSLIGIGGFPDQDETAKKPKDIRVWNASKYRIAAALIKAGADINIRPIGKEHFLIWTIMEACKKKSADLEAPVYLFDAIKGRDLKLVKADHDRIKKMEILARLGMLKQDCLESAIRGIPRS